LLLSASCGFFVLLCADRAAVHGHVHLFLFTRLLCLIASHCCVVLAAGFFQVADLQASNSLVLQAVHTSAHAMICSVMSCCCSIQVADLRASYSLVLQAGHSNLKLVAWHRCRLQNAPVVATAAAMAMAEQQGSQEVDADSIITAQVCSVL
jgi:hypothetical protein